MRVTQLLSEGKRDPKLTYTPTEVKGKVERLTVQLKGKDSTAMTKLLKEYSELADSIEILSKEKDALNKEIKSKVLDLFEAEDDILTRVVETVSFTATVAKSTPQGPDKEETTIDYTAILKELAQMVPDLDSKIQALTKTYTTVSKKAAAKPKEPALRVDVVKEGVVETVLGYVSKVVESFKSWCFSYDKRLAKLQAKFKASKKIVKEGYYSSELLEAEKLMKAANGKDILPQFKADVIFTLEDGKVDPKTDIEGWLKAYKFGKIGVKVKGKFKGGFDNTEDMAGWTAYAEDQDQLKRLIKALKLDDIKIKKA